METTTMTAPALFQTLARYNRWMNEKLYATAALMTDEDRKSDKGAFFGSLHNTLNHILWADHAWLNRLAGCSYDLPRIGTPLFDDFNDLHSARTETDAFIIGWANEITGDWLKSEVEWTAGADKITRQQPRWLLITHMFNHQTHHRGQATTLISQAGLDVGVTDLPRMD